MKDITNPQDSALFSLPQQVWLTETSYSGTTNFMGKDSQHSIQGWHREGGIILGDGAGFALPTRYIE